MTPLQKEVYNYVIEQLNKGYSPTHDEIAAHVGRTKGQIYQVTMALVRQGYLSYVPRRHRSLGIGRIDQRDKSK